ncbi:MAG TPA: zinc dependent phospholipase C family protein [Deltaproteobacteria bacterium]|jgi:hypothetical protein|nr:zinc dependent phospholipase C family protein [Deltaproteobacteria bacterium]HOI06707.1 zinc dependent phospholipase C family protein [Deltaproteobacteria bacterium]
MPKENTHLWFAHSLLKELPEGRMLQGISANIAHYYLGSIIPDTFYYASRTSIETISEIIHGKDGVPTNVMILAVLDQAKGPEDIAFILGYITHCALDITFHPMVDSLSGDYYDDDPSRRENAQAVHRGLETCIDIRIRNSLRIFRLVSPRLLRGLAFESIVSRDFAVTPGRIESTLQKQILSNRMFASPVAYRIAASLNSLGILKSRSFLPLFYADVRDPDACIPDPVRYRDSATGTELVESLSALFARARTKALPMMEAAWGYSEGSVSREKLVQFIPGENLSTGKVPEKAPS